VLGNRQTMIFFGRSNTEKSLCPTVATVLLLARLPCRSSLENPLIFRLALTRTVPVHFACVDKYVRHREKYHKKWREAKKKKPAVS